MRISDWSSDVCSSDLDIIPHAPGTAAAVSGGSLVEVIIGEMEFLGSFWRSRLSGTALGDEQLVADFSINAVRRLSLDEGAPLTIALPASRLIAFPAQRSQATPVGKQCCRTVRSRGAP